jgi:general secretion pathway protein D
VSLPGGPAGVPVPGQPSGPPPIFKQEVRIVADEVTNSLVILATRRDYQLILDVLRRIDVTPRQVLLEVMIAEIRLTKDLEFGVAWAISGTGSDTRPRTGRLIETQPGGEPNNIFKNRPVAGSVGGLFPNAPRFPGDRSFAVITNRENFNVFINALQSRTNIKMLSAPHIIAADNREAHILVGDSIPILTSVQQSVLTQNATTVNSVQYRDTGKILTILPQVNSKGLVNMQIRQEVSAVGDPSFGLTQSPSFSTREAETTVVVQDGESVVIGGIIDDSISHDRSGIPYLMDVPVLGRVFRQESDNNIRTELIVLITPYVIRSRDDAHEVTGVFVERLEGIKNLRRQLTERGLKRPPPPDSEPHAITPEIERYGRPPTPPAGTVSEEKLPPVP